MRPPTSNDNINHLLPVVGALVVGIVIVMIDIVCLVNMRDWMTGTFLMMDTPGADGDKRFYVKPGAFIFLITAASILPVSLCARFAVKRLINGNPSASADDEEPLSSD